MVSGRGKARGFIKKDMKARKVFTFWVYDFRIKAKENVWGYLLERHLSCTWDSRLVHQIYTSYPIIRLEVFQCFNCTNKNCYWRLSTDKDFYSSPLILEKVFEKSERWRD